QDYLSSNRFSSGPDGQLTSKNVQYPFGSDFSDAGTKSAQTSYKFTGQEQDASLYYYGARYYDPNTVRFISVDPIADASVSPYAYAANNPLRYIDPTGMAVEDNLNLEFSSVVVDDTYVNTDIETEEIDFLYITSRDHLQEQQDYFKNTDMTADDALKMLLESSSEQRGWVFSGKMPGVGLDDVVFNYDNFKIKTAVVDNPGDFEKTMAMLSYVSPKFLIADTHMFSKGMVFKPDTSVVSSDAYHVTVGNLGNLENIPSVRNAVFLKGCEAGACGDSSIAQTVANTFGVRTWADNKKTRSPDTWKRARYNPIPFDPK
ncbi:RHS repeat-associated core domain-containing protein, partial [Candidatus Aenigmatarchaeota archaeon]